MTATLSAPVPASPPDVRVPVPPHRVRIVAELSVPSGPGGDVGAVVGALSVLTDALPTGVRAHIEISPERVDPPAFEPVVADPDDAVRLDPAGHRAWLAGDEISLRAQEFRLLRYLVDNPGEVHSRRQLLAQAWGRIDPDASRTVDVHIRRLRAKLGPAARQIVTVHKLGYRFDATAGGISLAPARGGPAEPGPPQETPAAHWEPGAIHDDRGGRR